MNELAVLEKESFIDDDLGFSGRKANKNVASFHLLGKSKHQQYFTSLDLSEAIFKGLLPAIDKNKIEKVRVLDPTCGSGRLLVPWNKAGANVIGIELDKQAGTVARRLIGKQNVRIGDLLDYKNLLQDKFDIVVTNPPFGIYWDIEGKNISFNTDCYGNSIESQSATLETAIEALDYQGLLAAIVPSSMFENQKDKKIRDYLFENLNFLLKATISNSFKDEYGIDVKVDLLIAKRAYRYGKEKANDCRKVEVDVKEKQWKEYLIGQVQGVIGERDIKINNPYSDKKEIPFIENIKPIEISNRLNITKRGITTDNASAGALGAFCNKVLEDYSPVLGTNTGILDAYVSKPALFIRGIDEGEGILKRLGFNVGIKETDRLQIAKEKKKYDFLTTPIYRPEVHQLLGYYLNKEYRAKETIKDKDSNVIFLKDKKYKLWPEWKRNKELVKVEGARDSKGKEYSIKTELDRGYLAISVDTEQGRKTYNEINKEEISEFVKAFSLPDIQDIEGKYSKQLENNKKKLEKQAPFLFEYQKEDIARLGLKPFGYLGYDMGGGKTISAAAWAKLRGYKRVLVVCQSSLVNNWKNELEKFGHKAIRLMTHRTIDKLIAEKRAGIKQEETTFYITSYEFLSLDTKREYDPWDCIEYDNEGTIYKETRGITSHVCPDCHKKFTAKIRECPKCKEDVLWTGNVCNKCGYVAYSYTPKYRSYPAYKRIIKLFGAVIVDEAQMAKTKNSGRGKAVRALKSKGKLILTGTLMKGYITDIFWNIGWLLGFDNPLFYYKYRGGSKKFLNEFGTFKFVTRQFEDTLSEGRAKIIPEVSNLNRFWRIMAPFMVRRLKDEMIELPEKNKKIIFLDMDREHENLYSAFEEWARDRIRKAMLLAGDEKEVNIGKISGALWKLRFAATVPTAKNYLLDERGPNMVLPEWSSWNKVDKIIELVKEIKRRGEKVIIFSGLRPMVSEITKRLKRDYIRHMAILASHSTSKRFDMIQDFADDKDSVAIVAGLNVLNRGFNITCANNVIIADLEYSPESTLQAEDRAHRTGQDKPVNVYYLLSKGTIDEDMFEIISKKQAAIENAIDGKAVHADVAKLLENSGDARWKIAKRLLEKPRINNPKAIKIKVAEKTEVIVKEERIEDEAEKEVFAVTVGKQMSLGFASV